MPSIVIVEKNGDLKEFRIAFKDKKVNLSKREYKWLFTLLNRRNYLNFAMLNYTSEEFDRTKYLWISLRYIHM